MKIRIELEDFRSFIGELRKRTRNGDFESWRIENVSTQGGKSFARMVYASEDTQYDMIQVAFIGPTKGELEQGMRYVDLEAKPKEGVLVSEVDFQAKSVVVLCKLCELLVLHCSDVGVFKVFSK